MRIQVGLISSNGRVSQTRFEISKAGYLTGSKLNHGLTIHRRERARLTCDLELLTESLRPHGIGCPYEKPGWLPVVYEPEHLPRLQLPDTEHHRPSGLELVKDVQQETGRAVILVIRVGVIQFSYLW